MKHIPYFVLLITVCTLTCSSSYAGVKDSVLNFIQRALVKPVIEDPALEYRRERKKDLKDVEVAHSKAKIVKQAKRNMKNEPLINHLKKPDVEKQKFHIDPVLNMVARRSNKKKKKSRGSVSSTSSGSSSSSLELQEWKDEWKEHWIQKKFEAINSSAPRGDTVNMLAARPWGVPCGDPNQHDMPWGTCMMPMECEPEFRIYRGDYFCGRTQFVCCALQQTTYDMYQGFDVSFDDSSLETDSEERRSREEGSKEKRRRKKARDRRKRRRERRRRKRKIRRNIRKIVREIRKILNKSYRNGTTMRKRKTKQLKKFIKDLKKQYRKDRKAVKNVHEVALEKIDKALQKRLDQVKGLNKDFMKNKTFRDIIVNGSVSPAAVRMLVKAYPELVPMLDLTRRSNHAEPDYLEYDIEYGLLYY